VALLCAGVNDAPTARLPMRVPCSKCTIVDTTMSNDMKSFVQTEMNQLLQGATEDVVAIGQGLKVSCVCASWPVTCGW
jgi:hypothetical protein